MEWMGKAGRQEIQRVEWLLGDRVEAGPWEVTELPGDGGRPRICKSFLAPDLDEGTSGGMAGLAAFYQLSKRTPGGGAKKLV